MPSGPSTNKAVERASDSVAPGVMTAAKCEPRTGSPERGSMTWP